MQNVYSSIPNKQFTECQRCEILCLSTEWNYCKIAFVKVLSTAFNRAYCRLLHAKIDLMGLRLH